VAEVAAMEALDRMVGIGVRMPAVIEPRLIIEAFRLDNEGVAFLSIN